MAEITGGSPILSLMISELPVATLDSKSLAFQLKLIANLQKIAENFHGFALTLKVYLRSVILRN